MSTRLHVVMPDELVARIQEALGPGQSRGDFIRRAVESYLEQYHIQNRITVEDIEPYVAPYRQSGTPPSPERPLGLAIQQAARSPSQAKRGVEPRPKKAR